jgi:hypothetical protein
VQSQANRLEESLLETIKTAEVNIPHVVVDFTGKGLDGITSITSLDAPHRVYDAILRDSLLDGKPFMQSPIGEACQGQFRRCLLPIGIFAHSPPIWVLALYRRGWRHRCEIRSQPGFRDHGNRRARRRVRGELADRRNRHSHLRSAHG